MTDTKTIHASGASVGRSVEESEHWRIAWVLLGVALSALAALNVFAWWIEFGGSIDPAAVIAAEPTVQTLFRYFGFELMGDSLGFGALLVVSALALSRDRSNLFAWILGGSVVGWIVGTAIAGFAILSIAGSIPADLTPRLVWSTEAFYGAFGLGLIAMIVVFPSGRLPTGSWRRVVLIALSLQVLAGLVRLFLPGPFQNGLSPTPYTFDNPFGLGFLAGLPPEVVDFVEFLFPIVAVLTLVRTYLKSGAEVRHQVKWIVAVIPVMVATSGLMSLIETSWEGLPVMVSLWLFAIALGVAITKYRLYDIDLIINRALVFGLLVGFITVVYATVVVGVGSMFGGSNVGWSIAATALVAVVFEPVRNRVQRWVNRLVYGARATPYEVLSDLTGRLAKTEREEGLLDRMAVRLAEGTGAARAVIWVRETDGFHAAACEPAAERPIDSPNRIDELPGVVVAIHHNGELLGALSVETARGDALTPTEVRLVDDLAGSAGLVMRRLRLDASLEQKARELEESRRRLVNAQDVERRRLERQLEEGAQQQVVALRVQLGLAQQQALAEGADTVAALIAQIENETQDSIDQITALANGIYPPLLEAEGLGTALAALAESAPVEVRVKSTVHDRYPLPVEGAVYFSISEAVTNAVKYGEAPISIEVSNGAAQVTFTVSDSGPGFDPNGVERGSGLNNMTDRLHALDGSLDIISEPGHPTTVTGRIPTTLDAGPQA
jgi:signal transduction histidine kinase